MFTIILAFIEAKYKHGFELLFVATFLIDLATVNGLFTLMK